MGTSEGRSGRGSGDARGWRRLLRAFESRVLGDRGERLAARYLQKQGFRILQRGYRARVTRGEIDLIAREGDVLVFVEVKTRRQGRPAEAVSVEKQRRLTLAAFHFLKRYKLLEVKSRFDVVAIVWPEEDALPQVEHFRNAFEPVGKGQMFR